MNIYIGYDSRETEAYDVCKRSLNFYSHNITPLIQSTLRQSGLYNRPEDPLASTEFTYTRFLCPKLNGYNGWCLFVDCDFVFLEDPSKLLKNVSDDKAVYVVKHPDYIPKSNIKMDGKIQSTYPRKNWSSLILWNCSHPKCQELTPEMIDNASPATLHRFNWLEDDEIGTIGLQWNWLVGYYQEATDFKPKALHFTDGGPWFKDYRYCEYADVYNRFKALL